MAPGPFRFGWPFGLFRPPGGSGGGNVSTPAPTPVNAGVGKPFIERDPSMPERQRRNSEKVSMVLNSLMRRGVLFQISPAEWGIDAAALSNSGGGLSGTFDSPGVYG